MVEDSVVEALNLPRKRLGQFDDDHLPGQHLKKQKVSGDRINPWRYSPGISGRPEATYRLPNLATLCKGAKPALWTGCFLTRLPRNKVLKIGVDLIGHLERLHKKLAYHGNIKPDQILYDEEAEAVQLMRSPYTVYCHARAQDAMKHASAIVGNFTSHREALSPQDDMESLGYVLIHLSGRLPWAEFQPETTCFREEKRSHWESLERLCIFSSTPKEIFRYFQIVKGFDSEPDYNGLRDTLRP